MTSEEIAVASELMQRLSDECAKYCRLIAERDATIAALRNQAQKSHEAALGFQNRALESERREDVLRQRAEAAESALRQFQNSRGISIPGDSSPVVKPEASNPCKVTPEPENAL